ncbi:hypothetical protein HYN48_08330 [Flavobacterium magnum]|uniref:GOLD domain-containing protein n=1 Tax=Flavobacterium magnum TaxID=2162713 RepID=A0A2S0REA0_9FLAO|nr:hypothetical protein [Flavobacterium magnum]AWA30083.1 hypothetical protein HYN48_08330 [Flavobacterium magnum]
MKTIKTLLSAKTLIVALLCVSLTSCLSDSDPAVNECYNTQNVGVTNVTGPTTAGINQPVTFDVTFNVADSCGSFLGFYEEATATNEKTITVVTKYLGCDCIDGVIAKTTPYTFKGLASGTYVLKFKITETTYKTMTIVVG